jgi:Fic family protein
MFRPQFQITQPLLATLKRIAVQVYVLNKQRLTAEAKSALRKEALDLAAAAAGHGDAKAEANYRRTLMELGDTPAEAFDLQLLLRLHYRLSGDLLPEDRRGRLRRAASVDGNGLAGDTAFEPPEPKVVPIMLNDLATFVDEQRPTLDPVLLAGIFHRQLLLVRPFTAANEPLAWLATRILLSGLGLARIDLLALEDRFQADRQAYLTALGTRGNYYEVAGILQFTPWLAYFANGILAELEALENRQRRFRASPATALRAHHRAILDYVDEHGFITDKEYSQLTDRAKATRSLDFKKLMELDLLVREGKGRGTFYRRKM